MGILKIVIAYLSTDRLKSWLGSILKGLRWVWDILWYPAALPVLLWLLLTGFGLKSCQMHNQVVREAMSYQDSVVHAQQSELWRLRADTLEANFEIRRLFKRLSDREKQEEAAYLLMLRDADDAALQAAVDSVYNRHARGSINQSGGQPAQKTGFAPILSGGAITAPEFNPNGGRSASGAARSLPGR